MFLRAELLSTKFKLVYQLKTELSKNPEYVQQVQRLTSNADMPRSGLKGTNGLYGSDEWWRNIESGVILTGTAVGTVLDIGAAGFPEEKRPKTEMHVRLVDGTDEGWTMRADDPQDISLYKVGGEVMIFYALDELKRPIGRFGNHLRIILEMAVSHPA